MQYTSLKKNSPPVDFKTATLQGQAPDKGLYFPAHLAPLPDRFWQRFLDFSPIDLAVEVMQPFVGDTIPAGVLHGILQETLDFDFPLVPLSERQAVLELFHGPTLAFKDVGARFMSRCLGYFSRGQRGHTTILVATSGDTGGAVAQGFLGVPGVQVVILFPKGKVSPVQEWQLTACGDNVRSLAVDGNFDDCQHMVKQAFADTDLQKQLQLSSANSINVARWLPQQLYYFLAVQAWQKSGHDQAPVIAVPSGNFGNLCAGVLAQQRGLPVAHFLAACNENDVVPRFLAGEPYQVRPAQATLSNAMDVGDPSNWVRILALLGEDRKALQSLISGGRVSDATTLATIARVFQERNYVLDPHGAVAQVVLEAYLSAHPSAAGFLLETAHPIKFPDTVEKAIGQSLPMPPAVAALLQRPKKMEYIAPEFEALKALLLSNPRP